MNFLPWFFAGTHLADTALAALMTETAVLLAYRRWTRRGLPVMDLMSLMLPGACLLLALRSALAGAGAAALSLFLVASLLAHLADIRRRWRCHQAVPRAARARTSPAASQDLLELRARDVGRTPAA